MIVKSKCFKAAQRQTKYSNVKKARVAAIAFSKRGDILAQAHNRLVHDKNKWSEHAEDGLIKKLKKNKLLNNNIKILVLRMGKKGPMMAKPCLKCQKLISEYEIETYYTSNNGEIKRL